MWSSTKETGRELARHIWRHKTRCRHRIAPVKDSSSRVEMEEEVDRGHLPRGHPDRFSTNNSSSSSSQYSQDQRLSNRDQDQDRRGGGYDRPRSPLGRPDSSLMDRMGRGQGDGRGGYGRGDEREFDRDRGDDRGRGGDGWRGERDDYRGDRRDRSRDRFDSYYDGPDNRGPPQDRYSRGDRSPYQGRGRSDYDDYDYERERERFTPPPQGARAFRFRDEVEGERMRDQDQRGGRRGGRVRGGANGREQIDQSGSSVVCHIPYLSQRR